MRRFFGRRIAFSGFVLFIFLIPVATRAQNFPVQVNVGIQSPNPVGLDGLISQKLNLTLLHKDFISSSVQVYFQMKIEGPGITIETPLSYKHSQPVQLTAGVPLTLDGTDVNYLFSSQNYQISGLDKSKFIRSGTRFPQGLYRFNFRVYDYQTGLPVSNWGTTLLFISAPLPPIINIPENGSEISSGQPQFVYIQFTPRHFGSQTTGNIQYKVRIVEVLPFDRNANEAMLSSEVPFIESYTDQTTLIIGPSESQFIRGRKYALQVQAMDVNGIDLFENDGKSEVVTFIFGNRCPVPQNIKVVNNSSVSADILWAGDSLHRGFEVEYKPVNKWSKNTVLVFKNGLTLVSLKPRVEYEVYLRGVCRESISKESEIVKFITDSIEGSNAFNGKNCGKPLPQIKILSKTPLTDLKAGDKFKALDFEIIVLSATGSQGKFSGNGTVFLPYTGKTPLPCHFEDIVLNEKYQLTDGKISLLRKPLVFSDRVFKSVKENWSDFFGENWNQYKKINYSGVITGVKNKGKDEFVISGNGGDQTIKCGTNMEIEDESGNRWFVSESGKVSRAEGNREEPFVKNLSTGEGMPGKLNSGDPKIFFSALKSSGIDAWEIRELTLGSLYDKLTSIDTPYYVGWKFLKTGNTDTLIADFVQGKKNFLSLDSIHFSRSDGTIIPFIRDGTQFKIPVTGRMNLYADAVWAWYYNGLKYGTDNRVILGKINLINVDEKKKNIVLVSVNGAGQGLDCRELERDVNRLMSAQCVNYSISKLPNLTVPEILENSGIKVDRNMLGMSYSRELSLITAALESRHPHIGGYNKNDTAWMFIVHESSNGEDGYMALNRNYGFLFLNGKKAISGHTLAHETGHGLLNLEHTFLSESQSGFSQNLMDYSPPFSSLNYSQWIQIFDNKKSDLSRSRIVQKAAEGKIINGKMYSLPDCGISDKNGILSFVTPAGKIIVFPADSLEKITFSKSFHFYRTAQLTSHAGRCNGALTGFQYAGTEYRAIGEGNVFNGYVSGNIRFDDAYRYRNNKTGSYLVFGGFENSNCRLIIKRGEYTFSGNSDTLIERVLMVKDQTIVQIDFTDECLEFFRESELTPYAKKWWIASQKNENYHPNESVVRRIVRLIHDLGNDYRYFDYNSYKEYISKYKPGFVPPFVVPEQPFDSINLRLFENYLRTCIYALSDQNRAISGIISGKEALQFLLTYPVTRFEWFDLKNRVRLLRLLVETGLKEYSWSGALEKGGSEALALLLLTSSPAGQVSELLDSLIAKVKTKGEAHLLAGLCKNISGLDGDNYLEFTQWLTVQLYKYRPLPRSDNLVKAFEEQRVLNFSAGFWGDGLSNRFTAEGRIQLKARKALTFYTQDLVVEPYQWVYLKFTKPFEFLGKKYAENSGLKVPAVMVYAMFETENSRKLQTTGGIIRESFFLAIGLAEFRASVSFAAGGRKIWYTTRGIADVGLSLGDVSITAGLGDYLSETVPGQRLLENWNTIQLYYGIGSIAEVGLTGVIKNLYRDYSDIKALGRLSKEDEEELQKLLATVETKTGVMRPERLLSGAGKISKGKNLIPLEAPVGEFRTLVAKVNNENKHYRAADFWKQETDEMEHYITRDGMFYIKRHPGTGRVLLIDIENSRFVGFHVDESGVFKGDYESMATTMRTIHGLPGGLKSVTVGGRTIEFSKDKINLVLGRYDPSSIDPNELGTKHIMEQLELLKNYSFASKYFELMPGAVHILNIPEGLSKLYSSKGVEFWDAFNKNFLDIAVQNKDKVNVILMTDPRKTILLSALKNGRMSADPSYFARELFYLSENNVNNLFFGLEKIKYDEINLKYFGL